MFTLSTFHTLYLFDKTRAGETCQRERKDESGRPEDCRGGGEKGELTGRKGCTGEPKRAE